MADNSGIDSRNSVSADRPLPRSFSVEAHIGRWVGGFPFAHIDIGMTDLRVRVSFPWFVARSAAKDTITAVSIGRTITGGYCLAFDDSATSLADVHVHLRLRPNRLIDELRRCGYLVVDRKPTTGLRLHDWRQRNPPR